MRKREALRAAKRFVRSHYSEYSDCYVEVVLEQDGERRRSWSFGVHIDEEDERFQPGGENMLVGYVHANGHVEGLY